MILDEMDVRTVSFLKMRIFPLTVPKMMLETLELNIWPTVTTLKLNGIFLDHILLRWICCILAHLSFMEGGVNKLCVCS